MCYYQFWHKFDSWRDFSKFDEHKIEQADGRDQKRYYIQENKNARARRKKDEYKRLERLVTQANKIDPRLIRFEKLETEEKERVKREKQEAKDRAEQEKMQAEIAAKAAEEAELKAKSEAAAKAKDDKIRQKKQLRKLTKSLKGFSDLIVTNKTLADSKLLTEANMDKVLDKATIEELGALNEALTGKEPYDETGAQKLIEYVKVMVDAEAAEQAAKDAAEKKAQEEEEAKREKERNKYPWSQEETNYLIKAVKNNPGGTRNRWEKIAEYVNTLALPHARNAQECTLQSKWIETHMAAGK